MRQPLTSIATAIVLCLCAAACNTGPRAPTPEAGQPGGADARITDLPRIAGVTVGKEVSDWKGQGLVIHALAGSSAVLHKSADFQATGRLGWNEEGLLLQVDVIDSTPRESPDVNLYKGDSVELLLATTDKAAGLDQIIATPGRTAENPQPRIGVFDYRAVAFKKDAPPYSPRMASKVTDHGYIMDVLLPWASMKVTPAPGTVVGVRFAVNDSDGQGMQQFGWANQQDTGLPAWGNFPLVRLAGKPSSPFPLAVWGGYDEFKSVYINAVAEPTEAGKAILVYEGNRLVESARLVPDGARATAAIRLPFPPPDQTQRDLTVLYDHAVVQSLQFPDLVKMRKDQFLSSTSRAGFGGRGRGSGGLVPVCKSTVFAGDTFPVYEYPDPERVKQLVGACTVDTAYYNAQFARVQKAAGPGRYGAVTTAISPAGDSFALYQTLYCTGTEAVPATTAPQSPQASAAALAAAKENPSATAADAARIDREWWQALRDKLNAPAPPSASVRYEYFVRLPNGYDTDPNKRWPVIFYLHGSARGEDANRSRNDGPQGMAKSRPDFPFIVVSLRSPGGWMPAAVEDVIDKVAATCRTDPTRYYLTGFSMGGGGTWSVAMDRPERFAAIACVSGTGRGGDSGAFKGMGVWVINGADDTTVRPAGSYRAYETLKAAGVDAKWTEIPHAGHTDADDIAYRWDELYTWFLQYHR